MDPITAGLQFGRYVIRGKLGAGGMGDVFLADDTQLGRRVALKFLKPETETDPHAQRRLLREARAAAILDHPHICSVYEVGDADSRPYIAMQYVEGEALDARLRRSPLDLHEILASAVQIVDALCEAHAQGILHRDIKPAKIMLTTRGDAKVMDFGLAKHGPAASVGGTETVSALSGRGDIVGTAAYMSPEQARGEPLDSRSDLFSLGVLLYEMVSGQRAFQGASSAEIAAAILTHEPSPLARFAPNTPAELERIVNGNRAFWKHPFVKDGHPIPWDDGIRTLVDRTGLPGPRSWSNQSFPEGRADHPVTDITWYEADAYAAFRGKTLATIFQWEKAARDGFMPAAAVSGMPWGAFYPGDPLKDRANFGKGPLPTTSAEFGMSAFGAYNMAGNVAEWTANDSSDGFLATGGAWADPTYMFALFGGRPGFFSSEKLGFRCARGATKSAGDQGGMRIELAKEVPVYTAPSPQEFEKLASAYRYEKTPLEPRIEQTIETPEWLRERITFNGANGERAIAYLYLPKHAQRPLQVLHLLPASYRAINAAANPINFASRIRAPKLILQGRYDEDTPLRTATDPFFKLLSEPKRLALFEGGHVPPLEVVMSTTIPWLEEQLGRVVR